MKTEVLQYAQAEPLTPEQQALAAQYTGLVAMHLKKRVHIPREPTREREFDDLFQEGCVALVRAAKRYDPERNGSFAAFVLPRIRGAVHSALKRRFSTIHVPARAQKESRADAVVVSATQRVETLTADLLLMARVDPRDGHETVRHGIRRRFERAVQLALTDAQARKWPRRDPYPIMVRIARERLLICDDAEQTTLRQIATEEGVCCSRVASYEMQLVEIVSEHLARDPQLPVLIRFAGEAGGGFGAPLDTRRRQLLRQAELDAFDQRFPEMSSTARAELLYALVERSADEMTEVIRNLVRMATSEEGELAITRRDEGRGTGDEGKTDGEA